MSTSIRREPATLLFISLASQMFPHASNAELERAAAIAARHFRKVGFTVCFQGDNDYYVPIDAIASALDREGLAKAEKQLEALNDRVPDVDLGAVACARWGTNIDAGVLFGVWLGAQVASIAKRARTRPRPGPVLVPFRAHDTGSTPEARS